MNLFRAVYFVSVSLFVVLSTDLFSYHRMSSDSNIVLHRDSLLVYKKLDNGFSYYLKKMTTLDDKIYLQFVVNAGSDQEAEDQIELAHVFEHVATRGTRQFPDLKRFVMSKGLTWGNDFNAFTWPDYTLYVMSIPKDSTRLLMDCLSIIRDWAQNGVDFDKQVVDSERNIVLQEIAMFFSVADSIRDLSSANKTDFCRLPNRSYTTRVESVKKFRISSLRRYYRDWYRPNLQAIFVVGDFDVGVIQQQIIRRYSKLSGRAPERYATRTEQAGLNAENRYNVECHREIAEVSLKIDFGIPYTVIKSVKDIRDDVIRRLYTDMINFRNDSLIVDNNEHSSRFNAKYSERLSVCGEFFSTISFSSKSDQKTIKEQFVSIISEVYNLSKEGFSEIELSLAKKRFVSGISGCCNTTGSILSEYLDNFRCGSIILDPYNRRDVMLSVIEDITDAEITEFARKMNVDKNRRIAIVAPAGLQNTLPTEADLEGWITEARSTPSRRFLLGNRDNSSACLLLDSRNNPQDNSGLSCVDNMKIDATTKVSRLLLQNGIVVLLKQVPSADEIYVGLENVIPFDSPMMLDTLVTSYADDIVLGSGVMNCGRGDWVRYLRNNMLKLSYSIDGYKAKLWGEADASKLEILLKWVHLVMAVPKIDTSYFDAWKDRLLSQIDRNSNIGSEEAYYEALSNDVSRDFAPNREDLDTMTVRRLFRGYKELYTNGGNIVISICGNYDSARIHNLVSTYLASIDRCSDFAFKPGTPRVVKCKERSSSVKCFVESASKIDRVDIRFSWFAPDLPASLFAMGVLRLQYERAVLSKLRDSSGLSYAPRVYLLEGSQNNDSIEYTIGVSFDCSPNRVDDAIRYVIKELHKFADGNFSLKELVSAKEQAKIEFSAKFQKPSYVARYLHHEFDRGRDFRDIVSYKLSIDALDFSSIMKVAKGFQANSYRLFMLSKHCSQEMQLN